MKYFEIIAIAELGSNTFMATGTNTVVLFLRRRNNYDGVNLNEAAGRFFVDFQDVTLNGIEKPFCKYINYVWENISFADYVSLLKKEPNSIVANHEIYKEYRKKIKAKTEKDFWNTLIETEKEKLLYFILTYPQKVILVKTGEKNAEKRFLGYEFSNRRGSEGIHPIQRGKTIAECTKLFDEERFDNEEKASTYIYKAFSGDYDFPIHESLKSNISHIRLVDMLTFNRVNFTKSISTNVKKKIIIESKWDIVKIDRLVDIVRGASPRPIKEFITDEPTGINWIKIGDVSPNSKYITATEEKITKAGAEKSRFVKEGDFILSNSMSFGRPYILKITGCIHDGWLLMTNFSEKLHKEYFYYILTTDIVQNQLNIAASGGTSVDNLNIEKVSYIKIPLPPLAIQQKIVSEIEVLEKREEETKEKIKKHKNDIVNIINSIDGVRKKLREVCKYSDKRIDYDLLTPKNYVGVDNMLQNTAGKIDSNFVINSGTATEYHSGDILLSNIRPYLKKIWYADNDGGCSNDVLVLQKTDETVNSKYIFYNLKQDRFFDYEMQAAKGVKMPRGDKQHILDYKIPFPSLSEQQKIITQVEKIEAQIAETQKIIDETVILKNEVLKKYGIY